MGRGAPRGKVDYQSDAFEVSGLWVHPEIARLAGLVHEHARRDGRPPWRCTAQGAVMIGGLDARQALRDAPSGPALWVVTAMGALFGMSVWLAQRSAPSDWWWLECVLFGSGVGAWAWLAWRALEALSFQKFVESERAPTFRIEVLDGQAHWSSNDELYWAELKAHLGLKR